MLREVAHRALLTLLLASLWAQALTPLAIGVPTYRSAAEVGDWAVYQVVEASGNFTLYGLRLAVGDELRFVVVGYERAPIRGAGGELSFYVEWARCDVYLNGHLVLENASTNFVWPFWPASEGFWANLSALEAPYMSVERGPAGLATVELEALGFELTWQVDERTGTAISYRAKSVDGRGALEMHLVDASTRPDNGLGQGVLPILEDYWPMVIAAATVVAIAAIACLLTGERGHGWY